MIFDPSLYFNCISEGRPGKVLALSLWLDLHGKGYMGAGFPGWEGEDAFWVELEKLQS
jgi:hypothetical protein